jgi:lipid-binding SYLF domain-containing protein
MGPLFPNAGEVIASAIRSSNTLAGLRSEVYAQRWRVSWQGPGAGVSNSPSRNNSDPRRVALLLGLLVSVAMRRIVTALVGLLVMTWAGMAAADEYADTIALFKDAGESAKFFSNSYGYAVFPTIGKGGLVVGGAHGEGRVFRGGKYVGDATVTQVSVGFQAGGQAYSQIVFFEDKRAFDEFTKGDFEFGADVNAVAITAAAGAKAGTAGATAGASGGKKDATTAGKYHKGLAVFVIVKGGAMYEASVGGQKFSYKPRGA